MFKFRSPCTCYLAGSTQTGKTTFMFKLIKYKKQLFKKNPNKIIYCYSVYQPVFNQYKKDVTFHQGLINLEDLNKMSLNQKHTLLILDDLLLDIVNSKEMVHLFCTVSHHKNISVFFLSQSLYPSGKYSVILNRQMCYMILFRNLRDSKQITVLASQIYPKKTYKLTEAYNLATKNKSYGYLLIDLNPCTIDEYRLRSNIFPNEKLTIYKE